MALTAGERQTLHTLIRAAKADRLALVQTRRKEDGRRVVVICAVNYEDDEEISLAPFAMLFGGNPYEELIDPTQTEAA